VVKVLIAGASGAVGSHLVPQLVERGHDVVGSTRSAAKVGALRTLGAEPVVVDALDPDSVADMVAKAQPDVIVHQLTALSGPPSLRHLKRMLAATNRLRTEGTDHLLAAARAVGVQTFVAQSNALWMERAAGPVADEDARLEPHPPADVEDAVAALRHVEEAVTGITWADGVVLRYGGFYGPGTSISLGPEDVFVGLIRKRRFPVIGRGQAVWSFVHIADAAAATVDVVEGRGRGIYNVADDEPATMAEWLPVAAATLGAPVPRRVPRWIVRLIAGEFATTLMTELRGASNAKAKRELAWAPRYPSWREGFVTGLG
jgi:2-alkyl-3-oxoalkanoate reductase